MAKWYYSQTGTRVGPIEEDHFEELVMQGTVTPDTLVWRTGMADWQPLRVVRTATFVPPPPPAASAASVDTATRTRSTDSGVLVYAGVLRRWFADVIDGIITAIVGLGVNMVLGVAAANAGEANLGLFGLGMLTNIVLGMVYYVWFTGARGATPGKIALGLKVVKPDGGEVSYGRAFGRYFGETLSAILLGIGYLMAAFDDQKRTLHDRICETRVIKVG
jgi:uncharacterized RDD family membrane protein YckC